MNLSLQLGRAMFAVGFAAIAGACAVAQQAPMADTGAEVDAAAPNVAHNRLEIVTLPESRQEAHWVVASVRVGMPEKASGDSATAAHRVASRTPNARGSRG
jgi:hypothetical protein